MRAVITALIAISLALVPPGFAQDSGGYAKSLFAQLHPEDQTLAKAGAKGWRLVSTNWPGPPSIPKSWVPFHNFRP